MTPERVKKLREVLARRQPDLTVVTDYVHKGQNLSAIVRSCDAVGIGDIHSVVADHNYRPYKGTAKGSHRWVHVHRYQCLNDALLPLQQQGFQVIAAHLDAHSVDFRAIDYTRPTALLMGAEKRGVSGGGLELADQTISIPMVGMVESFNVSVAAGIILCEAQRQRQQAGFYNARRIDDDTFQRLFFQWGHPQVRRFCDENSLTYPPLREDGEIENPSAWYQAVRDSLTTSENCENPL